MSKKSQQLCRASGILLVALYLVTLVGARNLLAEDVVSGGGSDLSQQQLLQNQMPSEDDASVMRRQLPDLIAQARTDRNMERALLKMLINAASMRSMMNQAVGWQESQADVGGQFGGGGNQMDGPSEKGLRMSARLEQVIDSLAGNGNGYPARDQYDMMVDKREYIKPCFFNAVTCAKNPYRKLT